MEKQVTLATEVTYSGIGLHSGKDVTMTLQPGKPGTGIVFVRTIRVSFLYELICRGSRRFMHGRNW